MDLTTSERTQLHDGTIERVDGAILRPSAQWAEILQDMSSIDAAARILGDIACFQANYRDRRRRYAMADVLQLARALDAWRTMSGGE